ncbi:MAG: TonB family protein [Bacteroidales bacterium]|nr:TonB family protein [Bacteroidales bacterium]
MDFSKRGILGTLIIHTIVLALFVFLGFITPLPLPSEEGILINFGDQPAGSGTTEPRFSEPPSSMETVQPVPQPVETKTEIKEDVITQNFEDAPVIEKKEVKKETKKPEVTTPVKKEVTEIKQPEEKPKEVNTRALYSGKNRNTDNESSEGTTQGTGNQGNPFGSENSDNHSLGLSQGSGGPRISLDGRNPLHLPAPNLNFQREGKVVVVITVDRDGNVQSATPGAKGSTTLDENLLEAARKAALASKFDIRSDAPVSQKGTITYYFKLK